MSKTAGPLVSTEAQDAAIAAVVIAGEKYGAAKQHEMALEDQRALVKSEAIARIMALPDPQKDGKLYSATAAEAIVMTDAVYALHRKDQGEAVAETIRCEAAYKAACYRAQCLTFRVIEIG
jgi:hypothetical protein